MHIFSHLLINIAFICSIYNMNLVSVGFDIGAFMIATYACILCFMWYTHFVFSNPISIEYKCGCMYPMWNSAYTYMYFVCFTEKNIKKISLFLTSDYFICLYALNQINENAYTNLLFSIFLSEIYLQINSINNIAVDEQVQKKCTYLYLFLFETMIFVYCLFDVFQL